MTSRMLLQLSVFLVLTAGLCLGTGCGDAWSPQLSNTRAADAVPTYSEEGPLDWSDESAGGSDSTDEPGDDDLGQDDGLTQSEAGVVALEPAPDSTTHHYRLPLIVTFDGDASGSSVSLSGPSALNADQVIPTEATWNDAHTLVSVQPGEFLLPLTTYTVTLDVGDARLDYSFTTSSAGGPIDAGVTLAGRTYALTLLGAEVIAPVGLATYVAQLPSGLAWLWGIEAGASGDELDIAVGFGEGTESDFVQDQCANTRPLGGSGAVIDLQNSYFSSSSGDFELLLGSQLLVLEQGWIDGDFASDATEVLEVGVRGWLRANDLAAFAPASEETCDWLASELSAECQTCPSGVEQCIWVELRDLGGSETALDFLDSNEDEGAGDGDDDDDGIEPGDDDTGATGDPEDSDSDDDIPPFNDDCGGPDYDPFACSIGAEAGPSASTLLLLLAGVALSVRRRSFLPIR